MSLLAAYGSLQGEVHYFVPSDPFFVIDTAFYLHVRRLQRQRYALGVISQLLTVNIDLPWIAVPTIAAVDRVETGIIYSQAMVR